MAGIVTLTIEHTNEPMQFTVVAVAVECGCGCKRRVHGWSEETRQVGGRGGGARGGG